MVFLSPSGGAVPPVGCHWHPFGAAFGGGKRIAKKKFGAPAAPHSFESFRRVMRFPNMCLVLKFDNGKVVSRANEQTDIITDRVTQPSSSVL